MPIPTGATRAAGTWKRLTRPSWSLLLLSLSLHLPLALLFGHAYDQRIFMATGYLVGSGQNPYIAQNLTAVFDSSAFQGMTSVGYPPPWPIVLGLLYRGIYMAVPNLLIYNLAIKLPVVAANICLAYLVVFTLKNLGADAAVSRRAWGLLLLSPLLLYFATAWGQFDSIVALLSLLSLILLYADRLGSSAVLLALEVSFKPTALPLFPVAAAYLMGKSRRQTIRYTAMFLIGVLMFCAAPFAVLGWSPTPILRSWNVHFTVAGGMSLTTFFELLTDSYQLPGGWWLLGWAWIPALGVGVLYLRPGIHGFVDLLKKGTGLILVFFLTRTWLSEPNVILLLPFVLLLTSIGELNGLALTALIILPLSFTIFNASPPQLLFPSFPGATDRMLMLAEDFRTARLFARTALAVLWQIAGWWMVSSCLKRTSPVAGENQC